MSLHGEPDAQNNSVLDQQAYTDACVTSVDMAMIIAEQGSRGAAEERVMQLGAEKRLKRAEREGAKSDYQGRDHPYYHRS